MISKKTLEGDDDAEESELKYLQIIRDIRENDAGLFEKIKHLPKKARTGKVAQASSLCLNRYNQDNSDVIIYFDPNKPIQKTKRNLVKDL